MGETRQELVTNATATLEAPPAVSSVFASFVSNISGPSIREEKLDGKTFVVVPMVSLVEGVSVGSHGSVLYESQDIAKTLPSWNHRPLVVNHPELNGRPVSACSPEALEKFSVGLVMRSSADTVTQNGKTLARLKHEAWIDPIKCNAIAPGVLSRLKKGEIVEVSTGLFFDTEAKAGKFGDESYAAIARNYRPDHVAILPYDEGACSVKDGAGLGRNSAAPSANMAGEAGNAQRKDVPQIPDVHAFADHLDQKGVASNLERVPVGSLKPFQTDLNKSKVARMKKRGLTALRSKPLIASSDDHVLDGHHRAAAIGELGGADTKVPVLRVQQPADAAVEHMRGFPGAETRGIRDGKVATNMLTTNAADLSHDETRKAIYDALDNTYDKDATAKRIPYLHDVYDGHFVFDHPKDGETYSQPYELDESGKVVMTGLPSKVKKVVQYQDGMGNVVGNALLTVEGDVIVEGESGPRCVVRNIDGVTSDRDLVVAEAEHELLVLNAAATKTEDGKSFPASAYAYVPDASLPSGWKLRLYDAPGDAKPSVKLTADAATALGKGFRGKKVLIPAAALGRVKAKVHAAWKSARKGTDAAKASPPAHLKTNAAPAAKEKPVTKSEMIVHLITNKKFSEDDRKGLELMSEASLASLVKNAEAETASEKDDEDDDCEPGMETGTDKDGKLAKAKKLAETAAASPAPAGNSAAPTLSPEDQAVLAFGRQVLAQRRADLVSQIVANKRNAFSAQDLAGMADEALVKLAKSTAAPVENAAPAKLPSIFMGLDAQGATPAPTTNVKPPQFTKVDWKAAANTK